MVSKTFQYFLVHKEYKVFLYTDTVLYASEAECLNQYEKGLSLSRYNIDSTKIGQVWSELAVWGLLGRVYPVELVKILCANGASIEVNQSKAILKKSYSPVKYVIPIQKYELEIIKPVLDLSFGFKADANLDCFYWSENKLHLGVFYCSTEENADLNFPKYCDLVEIEMLLPLNEIHKVISRLFNLGFKIVAEHIDRSEVLAHFDLKNKIIYGLYKQITISYLADNCSTESK